MRYGDVRLRALCGFVLGTVVGLILIAIGRGKFGREIPFAPYPAAGAIYVSLYGMRLAEAVRNTIGGS
ncbi:MAG: hypothetical protein ABI658_12180 [Acidimicrobiales bacterium]